MKKFIIVFLFLIIAPHAASCNEVIFDHSSYDGKTLMENASVANKEYISLIIKNSCPDLFSINYRGAKKKDKGEPKRGLASVFPVAMEDGEARPKEVLTLDRILNKYGCELTDFDPISIPHRDTYGAYLVEIKSKRTESTIGYKLVVSRDELNRQINEIVQKFKTENDLYKRYVDAIQLNNQYISEIQMIELFIESEDERLKNELKFYASRGYGDDILSKIRSDRQAALRESIDRHTILAGEITSLQQFINSNKDNVDNAIGEVNNTTAAIVSKSIKESPLKDASIIIVADKPGWDVSFSGAFTASSLVDRKYSLRSSNGGTVISRDKDLEDDVKLGIAAFIHTTYPKVGIWAPFSLGLGITSNNDVNYYFGTGLHFDKKAFLTIGVNLGPQKRLPGGVREGEVVSDPNLLSSLPTRTAAGFFISLSYAFLSTGDSLFRAPFSLALPNGAETK